MNPTEFLISQMEGMDDVTQVLIVLRTEEGEIWCSVDEENKEIRIGVPVGQATTPNQTLTMNYMEGMAGPIHFSQYAGREVAMGAARKWSLDDIAG